MTDQSDGARTRGAGWHRLETVLALALVAVLLTSPLAWKPAVAQEAEGLIRITEYMYDGSGGEFVELTNVGNAPVSLAGWSYDDDSRLPGVFDLTGLGVVQAGESVLFVEASPDAFRTAWGLCDGVKIIGPYSNNLGRGDEINIFDAEEALVDRLTYGDAVFPGSIRTQGASGWVSAAGLGANNAFAWTLSVVGDSEGSWTNTGSAIGSPGKSTRATVTFDACAVVNNFVSIDQTIVAGAIDDPTNPTALLTLTHPTDDPDTLTIVVSSSNESVLPAANVTVSGTGATRTVAFAPVARGVSTVTFTVTDQEGEESSVSVAYGASAQAPSASGRYHHQISDASAALDVSDGYMLMANDETNTLFLHQQAGSGLPVKTWSFSPAQLGTTSEIDIEGAARSNDVILWVGSHGNNRSGAPREERRTLFATSITGSGAGVELEFIGRYNGLWDDLRAWDQSNGHGLGANALGFIAGTAPGVEPNPPLGFNIEGFEFAPNGTTGLLAFRAPTIEVAGKYHALVVPVTNILALPGGASPAQIAAPMLLDLDGRSIRDLRRNANNEYLIIAGPTPQNATWALYTWNGSSQQPVFNQSLPAEDFLTGGAWEAIVSVPAGLTPGAAVRLVTDSGDTNFYGTGMTKDIATGFQKSYSQFFVLAQTGPSVPTDKFQCMNNGWQNLARADGTTFKNQGNCIQYVNTGR